MSKPISKSEYDPADGQSAQRSGPALRRKVLLYFSTLVSGGALVTVIYFLRLDTFAGWEKSLVDLVMVAVAVAFLISLYMAVDSTVRGSDERPAARPDGNP